MEAVRQWLMGVTACALLVSLLRQLVPKGAVGEVVRFAGGLVLLLAVLKPLGTVRLAEIAWDGSRYETALQQAKTLHEDKRVSALCDSIAERTGEYIETNAARMGFAVRAAVFVDADTLQPRSVKLWGERSEELVCWIEETLGIAKERQEWKEAR